MLAYISACMLAYLIAFKLSHVSEDMLTHIYICERNFSSWAVAEISYTCTRARVDYGVEDGVWTSNLRHQTAEVSTSKPTFKSEV